MAMLSRTNGLPGQRKSSFANHRSPLKDEENPSERIPENGLASIFSSSSPALSDDLDGAKRSEGRRRAEGEEEEEDSAGGGNNCRENLEATATSTKKGITEWSQIRADIDKDAFNGKKVHSQLGELERIGGK